MRFALGQSTEDHILNLHYSYSFLNSIEWRDPLGKKKSINLKNISLQEGSHLNLCLNGLTKKKIILTKPSKEAN